MTLHQFGLRQRRGKKETKVSALQATPLQSHPKQQTAAIAPRNTAMETLLRKSNEWDSLQKAANDGIQCILRNIGFSTLDPEKNTLKTSTLGFNPFSFSRRTIQSLWESIKKETQKSKSEIEHLVTSIYSLLNSFSDNEQAFIKYIGKEVARHHLSQGMLTVAANLGIPAPLMILLPLVLQAKMSTAEETPQFSIHKGAPPMGTRMCETNQSPERLFCEEVYVLVKDQAEPVVQLSSDFIPTEQWQNVSDATKQHALNLYQSCAGVDSFMPKLQNAFSQGPSEQFVCKDTLACGPEILDGLKPAQKPLQTSKMWVKGFCYNDWLKYISCPDERCHLRDFLEEEARQDKMHQSLTYGIIGSVAGLGLSIAAGMICVSLYNNHKMRKNAELRAKLRVPVKEMPISHSEKHFDDLIQEQAPTRQQMNTQQPDERNYVPPITTPVVDYIPPVITTSVSKDYAPPVLTTPASSETTELEIGIDKSSAIQLDILPRKLLRTG